jgi:hypothetical protein
MKVADALQQIQSGRDDYEANGAGSSAMRFARSSQNSNYVV